MGILAIVCKVIWILWVLKSTVQSLGVFLGSVSCTVGIVGIVVLWVKYCGYFGYCV